MNYSKTHQRFSEYLKVPESLERPEDFLGPNYAAVLNFWSWTDTLVARRSNEVALRWSTLPQLVYNHVDIAEDASYAVNPQSSPRCLGGYLAQLFSDSECRQGYHLGDSRTNRYAHLTRTGQPTSFRSYI
jgi:hypothetical protein